jgi:hypothetical protein
LPIATQLDVKDGCSMGVNDIQQLPGRQTVQLELAGLRLRGDEHRAVTVHVDVHGSTDTGRILDHRELSAGRDLEHLRHDGRLDSPRPRRDRDAVAADERNPFAPRGAYARAVVDVCERPQLAAGADIPDAHRAIGAERREPRAVRAEPGREDAARMCLQDVDRATRRGIPEPRGAVGATGRDEPPVRADPDHEHLGRVPVKRQQRLSGIRIANAGRLAIVVGSHEPGRVGRERGDVSEAGPDPVLCQQQARDGERVVQGLLGLDEDGPVVPPCRFRGFDREQGAPLRIDVEIPLRGRG